MSNGDFRTRQKASSSFHFLAGLGSGVSSAFILQPADLLKTRVQQQKGTRSLRLALTDILSGPSPFRQLWRGTTPSVIRTGAGSALYFGMLNQMRQYALRMQMIASSSSSSSSSSNNATSAPKLTNLANLATGAFARVAAGFIVNPVTVLKVRYESTQYAYTSLTHAATDIARREGIRGFFAGFGATAVRDAPYAGLYVLVYEQAKTRLRSVLLPPPSSSPSSSSSHPSAALPSMASTASVNFAAGVIAATTATTITNPFDAIKTRLQLSPTRYPNMLLAASMMLRDEGLRSMFAGLGLRIARKAISSALTWTVYEELLRRAERALLVQHESKAV